MSRRLPFRLYQLADVSSIKGKKRGRQICTDLDCHRDNGSLDFRLCRCHQAFLLGDRVGSTSSRSVVVGDSTRVCDVERGEPALCGAYGIANGH